MSFRLSINDLKKSDYELVQAALGEVKSYLRPTKCFTEYLHEGELLNWASKPMEDLLKSPFNHEFSSQIFLLSREGLLYYFPILLSLGLMDPDPDFVFNMASKFENSYSMGKPVEFSDTSKLIMARWKEIYLDASNNANKKMFEFERENESRLVSMVFEVLSS